MNIARNGNGTTQACAACKYQRRKCAPDCSLAPYFPHDRQRQFLNAHKLFGVRNITKIIKHLDPLEKDEAMRTIIYQSDVRANDPIGGCYRIIKDLEYQIQYHKHELEIVLQHLAVYRAQAQAQAQAHNNNNNPHHAYVSSQQVRDDNYNNNNNNNDQEIANPESDHLSLYRNNNSSNNNNRDIIATNLNMHYQYIQQPEARCQVPQNHPGQYVVVQDQDDRSLNSSSHWDQEDVNAWNLQHNSMLLSSLSLHANAADNNNNRNKNSNSNNTNSNNTQNNNSNCVGEEYDDQKSASMLCDRINDPTTFDPHELVEPSDQEILFKGRQYCGLSGDDCKLKIMI